MVGIAGFSLLMAGIAGFGLHRMSQNGAELREIARHGLPMKAAVTRITEYQLEQAIALERSLRYGAEMQSDPGKREQFDAAAARFVALANKTGDEFLMAGAMVAEFKLTAATARDREELVQVDMALKELDAAHAGYEIHARKILAGLRENDIDSVLTMTKTVQTASQNLDKGLVDLSGELDVFTQVSVRTAVARERSSMTGIIMFVAVGGLAMLAIGGLGSRWMAPGASEDASGRNNGS